MREVKAVTARPDRLGVMDETITRFRRPFRGLQSPPADAARARRIEARWQWPILTALAATIPAFYLELLSTQPPVFSELAYAAAALMLALGRWHTARHTARPAAHLLDNPLDALLVVALCTAMLLPPSSVSPLALALRLFTAFGVLGRMLWALRRWLRAGSIGHLLAVALAVLALCGAGFRWLEPTTPDFAAGLWLAFTTAATVGYGDLIPTTPASRIFAVFVVLLGYGVLTLVTAAIASAWVKTEERSIEREVLRDLHQQIGALREDLRLTREAALVPTAATPADAAPAAPAARRTAAAPSTRARRRGTAPPSSRHRR